MEIRLLVGNELQWAAGVATNVYNLHVLPYARTELEVEQFRQYVRPEHLMQEVQQGRLFVWGIFENGLLCAVSAMQNVGHITMLYVNPYCQRRGYATLLLNTMRMYALSVLHVNRMTINVFPTELAPFFYKRGFYRMQGVQNTGSFLSLECMLVAAYGGTAPVRAKKTGVTYTTRKVSNRTILIITAVVLLLLLFIGVMYALSYLQIL